HTPHLRDILRVVCREIANPTPIATNFLSQLYYTAAGIREQGSVVLTIKLPHPRGPLLHIPPLNQEGRGELRKREVRLHKTLQDSGLQESRTDRHGHPRRSER